MPGMNNWLVEIFPEYAPPRFDSFLRRLRHPDGRHELQIFVGQVGGEVAGLVQVFYRAWQEGLLADIDLLGVLAPHRRAGLGSALVRRVIEATQELSGAYRFPALGVVSLADPNDTAIIRLHEKLGGQIRTDWFHPCGDIIVWYPLLEKVAAVETAALTQQLQQFARLLG